MKIFTTFALVLSVAFSYAQNDRLIRDTGGGGSGWLKDSLPLQDVVIDALTNDLNVYNADSINFAANRGIGLITPDIWFSQSGGFTTNFHLSTYNTWTGTGYWNTTIDYMRFEADDSLRIIIDNISANKQITLGNKMYVDKFSALDLADFPSSFSNYGAEDEGKLAYNITDDVPMYWTGTVWVNLATLDDIPTPGTAGHSIQDEGVGLTQRSVLNFVGAGVTATDGGTETTVTIPGASNTAKFIVAGDQTETLQNVNGSSTWEIFPSSTQVVNAGSAFSYNTSTDRITYTAATSGYVRIWFHYSFDTNSLANDFNVVMRKNGTQTRAKSTITSTETGIKFSGSSETYIAVAQNDYFEIGGYFTGGSANMTLSELMWGAEFIGEIIH